MENNKQKNTNMDKEINNIPFYRKKNVIIPFFVLLIAAVAAVYWYIGQLGFVSTDDAFIDSDKLSVSSKILERVTELYVDEGDSIKAGQLLVQLDSTDIKAREKQAQAALALARESISLAKVNLDKALEDYDRAKKQYEDKIIPKENYDHSQKAYQAAKAAYNIDKTKIGTAEAQLNLIETQLSNTKIFAPMDGVVAKKWILVGDVVTPGEPLLAIYDLKNVWVTADLEETKLASVSNGDTVSISVDAYPEQTFEGTVFQIGSTTASEFSLIPPSNAAGNFTKVTQRVPIKISIKPVINAEQQDQQEKMNLLPGMSVEIKIKV